MSNQSNAARVCAEMLAAVAKADGKVLDIENLNASELLDCMASSDCEEARATYQAAINIWSDNRDLIQLGELELVLEEMDMPARVELLRSCWYLAKCDGELHPSEEALIMRMAESLGVTKEINNHARASAG